VVLKRVVKGDNRVGWERKNQSKREEPSLDVRRRGRKTWRPPRILKKGRKYSQKSLVARGRIEGKLVKKGAKVL